MAKEALIVWGGWDGHEPEQLARIFQRMLEEASFTVEVSDTLSAFDDGEKLQTLDLIVPVWTAGEISGEQCECVSLAVAGGTGLAGCHGGMCDAFRGSPLWQFITGGNWVAHPGGDQVTYTVRMANSSSPLIDGLHDFEIRSEQYYLHVDPAVEVLATTRFPVARGFHSPNGSVDMPTVWTKRWGHGRVWYTGLGHHADIMRHDTVYELTRRGMVWAAAGKETARRQGAAAADFQDGGKQC
jgi:uncharacterized protein